MRKLISKSKIARFAFNYAKNINSRFGRAAAVAIDGPTFYKRRLWKRYLSPDPSFKPISLTPLFQGHLETLREDGIVAIEGIFDQTAASLRELLQKMDLSAYRRRDSVTDFEIDIGFAVPEVMHMLSHPELCALFCNYYDRQAYYREHPVLLGMSAGANGVSRSSSLVHCDGYRQLTLHLLVNDTTAADTHLVFYTGTHKEPKLDYTRVADTGKRMEGLPTKLGTGRAGTLIVFDSGSGYHSGEYRDGQRVLLSLVVTTGWLPFSDPSRFDLDVLRAVRDRQPVHVQAMFERR
jgi:hypothetical protein